MLPKDDVSRSSRFEATTTRLVARKRPRSTALATALRVMGSLALYPLPPGGGPPRRRCLAEAGARRSTSPPRSSLVRERGLAIELTEGPPLESAPLDLKALTCRRRGERRLCARSLTRSPGRPQPATLGSVATHEEILQALGRVIDPELRKPVTELDMVRSVDVAGGEVVVTIALTVVGCPLRNSFQEQVAREVGAVEGVTSVRLEFDVMSPDERAALTTKLRGGRPSDERSIQLDPRTRVIAVASGKGGVGKSSLTANLARRSRCRATRSGSSTPTSTATRSRTCSGSSRSRCSSTS